MLGKVLGLVVAGVFIGAAAVELTGLLSRRRCEKDVLQPDVTGKNAKETDADELAPDCIQG